MTGSWQSSQTSSSTSRMYTAAPAADGGDQLAVLRRTLQQALDLVDRLDGPGRPAGD
jgi:hypothetical protein